MNWPSVHISLRIHERLLSVYAAHQTIPPPIMQHRDYPIQSKGKAHGNQHSEGIK